MICSNHISIFSSKLHLLKKEEKVKFISLRGMVLCRKTGKASEGPEQTAQLGTKHNQPKPCGSASTKLCSADPEDGAGQQAECPD